MRATLWTAGPSALAEHGADEGGRALTLGAVESRTETALAAAGASVWGFAVATFAESRWAEGGTRAALATGLGGGGRFYD